MQHTDYKSLLKDVVSTNKQVGTSFCQLHSDQLLAHVLQHRALSALADMAPSTPAWHGR